jgi:hypothetical protein
MMETIIKLYYAFMTMDVRSPIPHLAGPPGVGKSSMISELADKLGVRLHILNVARISPLELEGVQMPVSNTEGVDHDLRLRLLHNPLWTQLREGDIVLLDEFMRGFPEVYNGLLDIMTSREVAGFKLPKVFFIAASNSVSAYDEALRDRLLHIFVPDIRTSSKAQTEAKERFIAETGMYSAVLTTPEMQDMFREEILPMYGVLDTFKGTAQTGAFSPTSGVGHSMRNLIGQTLLREVQSDTLRELIEINNRLALQDSKYQFVILLSGRRPDPHYVKHAKQLVGNDKLSPIQAQNLALNFQLIEMEEALTETISTDNGTEDVDAFLI